MSKVLHTAKFARSYPLAKDWSKVLYVAYNTRWSKKHRTAAMEVVAEASGVPVTDERVAAYVDRYTLDSPHTNVTHSMGEHSEDVVTDHSNRGREPGWVIWKEV